MSFKVSALQLNINTYNCNVKINRDQIKFDQNLNKILVLLLLPLRSKCDRV